PMRECAAVESASLVGTTLLSYVVQEQIGEGGMGLVYRAVEPAIGKDVAIKLLRKEYADDPEQMRRLLEEARVVNQARHRNIIDIFHFGALPDGRQYLVMEYLRGQPLTQLIEERAPLPPDEVIPIVDEICAALAAAHGVGVIHRDLKPSNVFIVMQPDGSRFVKLLDFGIAKS